MSRLEDKIRAEVVGKHVCVEYPSRPWSELRFPRCNLGLRDVAWGRRAMDGLKHTRCVGFHSESRRRSSRTNTTMATGIERLTKPKGKHRSDLIRNAISPTAPTCNSSHLRSSPCRSNARSSLVCRAMVLGHHPEAPELLHKPAADNELHLFELDLAGALALPSMTCRGA